MNRVNVFAIHWCIYEGYGLIRVFTENIRISPTKLWRVWCSRHLEIEYGCHLNEMKIHQLFQWQHYYIQGKRHLLIMENGMSNRPFPRSMRSQGKRPGCGSRQAHRQRSRFQRMTLRYETLTRHYFISKFDFSWVTMTNMGKTEGIFLNLQCDCHRVASIFLKLINQRTYFSTWLPGLTALWINGLSLISRAHLFSIVRTGQIN